MEVAQEPYLLFPTYVRQGRSPKRYKSGFIDARGQTVVPPIYDRAHPFRNGRACVRQGGLWGAVNEKGDLVIAPLSGGSFVFSEDVAVFSSKAMKGVINKTGDVIIPPRYEMLGPFSDG